MFSNSNQTGGKSQETLKKHLLLYSFCHECDHSIIQHLPTRNNIFYSQQLHFSQVMSLLRRRQVRWQKIYPFSSYQSWREESASTLRESLVSATASSFIRCRTRTSDCPGCTSAGPTHSSACGPSDGSDAPHHATEPPLCQLHLDLGIHLCILLRLLVGVVQMLHEHCHHHVDQDKLRRQHKRHKVQGGDELQPRVAAVVTPWTTRWAFSQGVLGGKGEEKRRKINIGHCPWLGTSMTPNPNLYRLVRFVIQAFCTLSHV